MGSQSLKRDSPSGQLSSLAEATAAGPPAKFETLAGREPASSPSPSVVEVARTQGTQVDRQGTKHTWTTVFDQRVLLATRSGLQEEKRPEPSLDEARFWGKGSDPIHPLCDCALDPPR